MPRQPPKDFAGSAFAGCFFALLGGTLGFILGIGAAFVFFPDAGKGNAGFGLGAKFVVFSSLGAIIGAAAGLIGLLLLRTKR
jgi:hypothetical protein